MATASTDYSVPGASTLGKVFQRDDFYETVDQIPSFVPATAMGKRTRAIALILESAASAFHHRLVCDQRREIFRGHQRQCSDCKIDEEWATDMADSAFSFLTFCRIVKVDPDACRQYFLSLPYQNDVVRRLV